mmetsp:Transcript_2722/g.4785  ORF Transcript_2722/g.4785 Transcript_2722/m.4785 type:complete len:253 (-) Transcript_2722:39-797(-)
MNSGKLYVAFNKQRSSAYTRKESNPLGDVMDWFENGFLDIPGNDADLAFSFPPEQSKVDPETLTAHFSAIPGKNSCRELVKAAKKRFMSKGADLSEAPLQKRTLAGDEHSDSRAFTSPSETSQDVFESMSFDIASLELISQLSSGCGASDDGFMGTSPGERRKYRSQIRSQQRSKVNSQGSARRRNPDDIEHRKLLERVRKNREAAMKSRQEKKDKMKYLEEQNRLLQEQVENLTLQNETLRMESIRKYAQQ